MKIESGNGKYQWKMPDKSYDNHVNVKVKVKLKHDVSLYKH